MEDDAEAVAIPAISRTIFSQAHWVADDSTVDTSLAAPSKYNK